MGKLKVKEAGSGDDIVYLGSYDDFKTTFNIGLKLDELNKLVRRDITEIEIDVHEEEWEHVMALFGEEEAGSVKYGNSETPHNMKLVLMRD